VAGSWADRRAADADPRARFPWSRATKAAALRERLVASGVPRHLVSPDVEPEGVTLGRDVVVYQNVTFGPGRRS
jgi:hypothetical protein